MAMKSCKMKHKLASFTLLVEILCSYFYRRYYRLYRQVHVCGQCRTGQALVTVSVRAINEVVNSVTFS